MHIDTCYNLYFSISLCVSFLFDLVKEWNIQQQHKKEVRKQSKYGNIEKIKYQLKYLNHELCSTRLCVQMHISKDFHFFPCSL